MSRSFLSLILSAAVLAGCKSSTPTTTASASPTGLTGTWYGKFSPETSPDPAKAQMTALFGATTFTLDLDVNGRFKLTAMGSPLEGDYTVEGTKITMKPDTVMGKSLNDPSNPMANAMAELKEPQLGEIRDGGKTIFLAARPNNPNDIDLAFTREKPKEPALGPKTADASEMKMVGEWVFDESFDPAGKPKANETKDETAKRKAQEFARNMAKQVQLKLREDNTFIMNLLIEFRGTWKRNGEKILLTATEPKAALEMSAEEPKIHMNVAKNGDQLLVLNDKTNKPDFAMKRAGG
jgi:hypothetical protein